MQLLVVIWEMKTHYESLQEDSYGTNSDPLQFFIIFLLCKSDHVISSEKVIDKYWIVKHLKEGDHGLIEMHVRPVLHTFGEHYVIVVQCENVSWWSSLW